MNKVFTIILLPLFHYCYANKGGVPVFVIDDEGPTAAYWNLDADPFKKISSSEFADVVTQNTKRIACVIIFIEEELSAEDIALKDILGTPYVYIQNKIKEEKSRIIPSVSQPYKVLTNLFPPLKSNIFYLDDADKFKLPSKYIKYIFVSFQDTINATRVESLRNHDKIIKEVTRKVKKVIKGPIITFYTGKRNPNTIEKIDFPKKHSKGGKSVDTIRSKMALIRLSGMYSATQQRHFDRFTQKPFAVEERSPKNRYSTIMDYTDFQLRFVFSFTRSQWVLDKIELIEGNQTVGRRSMNIRVGWGWSYVCASPLVILNTRDRSSLIIPKYQIQAFRALRGGDEGGDDGDEDGDGDDTDGDNKPGDGGDKPGGGGGTGSTVGENTQFDKGINCEPYFNSHILAGLFVSFICLSIFAAGIVCMMDLKTNNRYDDPNGKEIMTKTDLVQG